MNWLTPEMVFQKIEELVLSGLSKWDGINQPVMTLRALPPCSAIFHNNGNIFDLFTYIIHFDDDLLLIEYWNIARRA